MKGAFRTLNDPNAPFRAWPMSWKRLSGQHSPAGGRQALTSAQMVIDGGKTARAW